MSSSKVIKSGNNKISEFSEFSFRNMQESGGIAPVIQQVGNFVPLDLIGSKQVVVVDEGPPLANITEAELDQRISEAFNDGLKEGQEQAGRELTEVLRALRDSSKTITSLREKTLRESEDEIINLVMLVARKVIIHEVTQNRSILTGVVQSAIADLSARQEITVHINPDDYLLVTSGSDDSILKELRSEHLSIKPDHSVESGFCLVDTEMGTIDASLDGQLDQIYRSLIEQRATVVGEQ